MSDPPFPDAMSQWVDWDVAAWLLARAIGVPLPPTFTASKATFWTDNPAGNNLHDALLALHRAGILDRRDDPDEQFRWNPLPS
ncbi:hypothetical protein ACQHIV_26360 [Kribbella sp. GL6]|uniref:hypothetical protein n=1 Tax=Kribbella sp. GL6 TaxID=3419765 RepID=UPI003D0745B4